MFDSEGFLFSATGEDGIEGRMRSEEAETEK